MKVCVVQIQFIFEPNSTLVCIMKKLNASLKSKKTYFTRQHALDTCNNKAAFPPQSRSITACRKWQVTYGKKCRHCDICQFIVST